MMRIVTQVRSLALFSIVGLSLACSADATVTEEAGTDDAGTDGADAGSESSDDGANGREPAHGIGLVGVGFNQGVFISLLNGTSWIGPGDRNARLVSGRGGLMQVFVALDATWVAREIECQLEFEYDDGTGAEFWGSVTPTANSALDVPESTCNITVPAEAATGDAKFRVSLWELEGATEGLEAPVFEVSAPNTGFEFMGYEGQNMDMQLVMVPVTYNGGTPPVMENYDVLRDMMWQTYPLQSLTVTVRDPADAGTNSLQGLLASLAMLKIQDGAAANVYYNGFVNGAQSGTVGLAGGDSYVSACTWLNNPQASADTQAHEVGHNHGMGHVACGTCGMAPCDPTYPHSNGFLGLPGYGILDGEWRRPFNTYDFMSYCDGIDGVWSSDWNFNQTWAKLVVANAMPDAGTPESRALAAAAGIPDEFIDVPVLRGIVGPASEPGGQPEGAWWTDVRTIDPELLSGNERISFEVDGKTVATELAAFELLSDDFTRRLTVRLPSGVDLDRVTIRHHSAIDAATRTVDLPSDHRLHTLVLGRRSRAAGE